MSFRSVPPSVDIDVLNFDPARFEYEFETNVEKDHNWQGEEIRKQIFHPGVDVAGRVDRLYRHPYLRRKDEPKSAQSQPGTSDAHRRLVDELVQRMPFELPSFAEPDMSQADAPPRDDAAETTQRHEPVQNLVRRHTCAHVREEPDQGRRAHGRGGPALAVDVAESTGRLALFCQCREDAGAGEEGCVGYREDGDEEDDIHDRVQAVETRVLDRDDERRGGGVARASGEAGIVVSHNQADNQDRDDIELCRKNQISSLSRGVYAKLNQAWFGRGGGGSYASNPPKYLLHCSRDILRGVCSLCSRETHQFSPLVSILSTSGFAFELIRSQLTPTYLQMKMQTRPTHCTTNDILVSRHC